MYLVAIAWIYVAMMMAVAEATNSNGTVLGGIVTFVLYGVLPVSIVMYLLGSPMRLKARKTQEQADWQAQQAGEQAVSTEPDTSGHAPSAAETSTVTSVGKKP
jgi:membrane protein implicated in regulation of membrane protease activity